MCQSVIFTTDMNGLSTKELLTAVIIIISIARREEKEDKRTTSL